MSVAAFYRNKQKSFLGLVCVLCFAAIAAVAGEAQGADLPVTAPPEISPSIATASSPVSTALTPNAISVFAGRLSTTSLANTMFFNIGQNYGPLYDNYIAGIAYDRDLLSLGYGFYVAAEVGVADRFGDYKECCNPVITSSSAIQSAELWVGPQIRYAGVLLFDAVRVGGSVTVGLSTVSNSIGIEQQREIIDNGNARLLYYFGPEITFSTPAAPRFELYVRVQHRSGGREVPILPTLGNMAEGYNANVVGLRYRF
jgi:hypothetical protein